MATLEELTRGAVVRGILVTGNVTIIDIQWHGNTVIEVTYKDAAGQPGNQLLYRDNEASLAIVTEGAPWSFDADGSKLRPD